MRMISKPVVWTLISGFLVSWTLPDSYRTLVNPNDEALLLDYMIVEINGQIKKVSRNEEISFVRGDLLKVTQAYLKNAKKVINLVELSGFKGPKEARTRNIDSSVELIEKEGSVDSEGTVYPLIAQSGATLHGAVFLRRVEPTLSYIDVLVNGKNRVMREGESLQMKKSDHFKVVNVVTNIQGNKNISFAVVPLVTANQKAVDMHQKYQILFRHKDYVFAKIPLTVESL
jgi:hypothetical protein